jgi:hypothetical protein
MVGNVLSQETLFREFRPYGKMKDIIFPEKDGPVRIWFKDTQSATAARNCLHGKRVDNTMLVINYDARDVSSEVNIIRNNNRIEWQKNWTVFKTTSKFFLLQIDFI